MKNLFNNKIPLNDLIKMVMQMEILLRNKVSIVKALRLTAEGFVKNPDLRKRLKNIAGQIESGKDITASFRTHSTYFPYLFTSLLEAGTRTADFPGALAGIRSYYTEAQKIRENIIRAMIYPAFTFFTALLVVGVMLTVILPSFGDIYRSFGKKIPDFTAGLLGLSNALTENWQIILLILSLTAFTVIFFKESTKEISLLAGIKIPIVSELLRLSYQTRFASAMAILLTHKIPLEESLNICYRLSGFSLFRKDIRYLLALTEKGELFTRIGSTHLLLTPYLTEIIRAGEDTADLGGAFKGVADYYRKEMEFRSDKFIAALEPALILLIGIVVGAILIAMYIPIFEISSGVGG